jgi:methionyl-tRNA formyltransferase
VGFAGTPDFAAQALEAILAAGFRVEHVLTQPDRPHGRGLGRAAGPVKALALKRGLALLQPASLKGDACAPLLVQPLDVLVVAAYGLILPPPMLAWPRQGCINIHASLLPRWRGAAPIARAILAGDRATGISIVRMEEGLDSGAVLSRHAIAIDPRETSGTLHEKLARLGAQAIVEMLRALERGEAPEGQAQNAAEATYARKIERSEALIDWAAEARVVDRVVRAFDPAPGAQTSLEGATIKIWKAAPLPGRFGAPGTVVRADGSAIVVACGDGALAGAELQREGRRRMDARAFLAGRTLAEGLRLGG